MMIVEEDARLEFDFGESEAEVQEIEELENLVSQFKKFPLALPSHTEQKCLAVMEAKQEPPLAIMDQVMVDASTSTSTSQAYGIRGTSR